MTKVLLISFLLFALGTTIISCSSPNNSAENQTSNISDETQKNKDDAEKYNDEGVAKGKAKEYSEAIKDFKKAIELNPNDARFYNNIASVKHSLQQDDEEALNYSNKAIELNPSVGAYYGVRAVINLRLGRLNAAQNDYDKAKELGYNGD